jgi:Zn-dependent protease with chaperone function
VKDLQTELRSAGFDRIYITPELNAGVLQVPRLGMLGWWRNELHIGLPMLETLSADQFRAVLAHEFVHLSRRDGRLGHWLYRLRLAWSRIFEALEAADRTSARPRKTVTGRFVRWFWPRFNALAFVLSRVQEFEADAQAAQVAGTSNCITALVRFSVIRQILEQKFWPELWCAASTKPAPVVDYIERINSLVQEHLENSEEYVTAGLREISVNLDTHPCLRERLHALGWKGDSVECAFSDPPASHACFGEYLPHLRKTINEIWMKHAAKDWNARYRKSAVLRDRISTIDGKAKAQDRESWWDRLTIEMEVEGLEASESKLKAFLAAQDSHAAAHYLLGLSLCSRNEKDGVAHLQRAMHLDDEFVPQASSVLEGYYRRMGDRAGIQALNKTLDEYEETYADAKAEPASFKRKDTLVIHGLDAETIHSLRQRLEACHLIKCARLGRKVMKYFKRHPVFVLGVELRGRRRGDLSDEETSALATLENELQVPGRLLIAPSKGPLRNLHRKLRKIPETLVYERVELGYE